ncbi:MAG: TolC family protein [Planctomycetaceae bacterium]
MNRLALRIRQLFSSRVRGLPGRRSSGWTLIQGLRGGLAAAWLGIPLAVAITQPGCSTTTKAGLSDLQYIDGEKQLQYFKSHNTAIEHPLVDGTTTEAVRTTDAPRSLDRRVDDEVREFTLEEAILTALSRNQVVEASALGGAGAARVLSGPEGVSTVYDSAIQETGVLFGRRGLEAALSDFDARWSTNMGWGRDRRMTHQSAPFSIGSETAAFRTGVDKALASGGSVGVFHSWDYLGSAFGSPQYPSSYSGSLGAQVRQPLLAGAGTEFTRVAGPLRPGFGAIAGVSQGVVIARINQDITLADFEIAVRNGLRDIENAYWDLYLAYRIYDTTVATHQSAFQTWREARTKVEVGTLKLADELQARDRFYETRAQLELALNAVYNSESALRRLIALPMNDGTVLRPVTEPVKAEFHADWEACLTDGLVKRTELRRQKWQIRSLQLQLNAARSLVRPQLDAVGSYAVNGFGDQLISGNGSSGYGSMTGQDLDTWSMGLEMSIPIGLRQPRSQARNYELQLARANAVLAAQERSIAHDIATAIQDVAAAWAAAESNFNRVLAAEKRVELLEAEREVGTTTLDLVLRAQASLAEAEAAYYRQVINYNKSITALNLSTGNLLDVNGVQLAEGSWNADAIQDARLRSLARTHARPNKHIHAEPAEFAWPSHVGTVERDSAKVAGGDDSASQPVPEPPEPAAAQRAHDGDDSPPREIVP